MVINGEVQIVGRDRVVLQRTLHSERKSQSITIQINAVAAHRDKSVVDYSVKGSVPAGAADLFAVVTDDAVQSSVSRGEKSGRILTRVSVVASMKRIAATSSSNRQEIQISLPQSGSPAQKQNRHLILSAPAVGIGRIPGAGETSF